LQALEKKRPGVAMKLYGDHPQTPDRIAENRSMRIGTIRRLASSTSWTLDFQQAKKRLR